ncbi:MAG: AAA family ATPase [Dysgonamonadaceae bacterium]|jgi:predicted AAA+ superfamily ATPase|nr:AAA family ATPase [Dysgonamonadaceae bacterium]
MPFDIFFIFIIVCVLERAKIRILYVLLKKNCIFAKNRQIDKTYILKKFCSEYFTGQVYLNFAEQPEYKQFFQPSLNPGEIISRIELFFNNKIDLKKAVLFFDEIQDCEEAIASLKFFAESGENYHIVSAGS